VRIEDIRYLQVCHEPIYFKGILFALAIVLTSVLGCLFETLPRLAPGQAPLATPKTETLRTQFNRTQADAPINSSLNWLCSQAPGGAKHLLAQFPSAIHVYGLAADALG
jgi:hypothetical protein